MSVARLGVNIDHVATLRQLRGTPYPDLMEAAAAVESAGAHLITVHLREDRRHIQDRDVLQLKERLKIPLNLEMSLSEDIVKFALKVRPDWACLVPEKRSEVTTEGGLDVKKNARRLSLITSRLKKMGIRVSYFIEPSLQAIKASREAGADAVELHTGRYGILAQKEKSTVSAITKEIDRIRKAAEAAHAAGLRVHAGHGLDVSNVRALARLRSDDKGSLLEEFNIGHFIVCRAAIVGMERATREMLSAIQAP